MGCLESKSLTESRAEQTRDVEIRAAAQPYVDYDALIESVRCGAVAPKWGAEQASVLWTMHYGNMIGDDGAKALATLCAATDTLQTLHLQENKPLGLTVMVRRLLRACAMSGNVRSEWCAASRAAPVGVAINET